MKKILTVSVLLSVFLTLFFVFPASPAVKIASAATVTITPDGDTTIYSSSPNNNYGTDTYLAVVNSNAGLVWSWISFSLSSIPAGATINSATLKLHVNTATIGTCTNGVKINLYRSEKAFSESTSTWNNSGLFGPLLPNAFVYNGTTPIEALVTDAVTAWWGGTAPNMGFVLRTTTTNGHCLFDSREGINKPTLTVNYTPAFLHILNPNLLHNILPTLILTPTENPTPTLTPTETSKNLPTSSITPTGSETMNEVTKQTPTVEPKKETENNLFFSTNTNTLIAGIIILAVIVLIIISVWLLKKKVLRIKTIMPQERKEPTEEETKDEEKDGEQNKEKDS